MKRLHIALVYNGSTHHIPDSPEDRAGTSDLQQMIRLMARTLRALGHTGEVPSPSFAIIELYEPPAVRLPVVLADFYRLADPAIQQQAASFSGNGGVRFEYTVISNIYAGGLPPAEAAGVIVEKVGAILGHQAAANRLEALLGMRDRPQE